MMSQTKNMEPPGMDGMAVAASSPMKAKASSRMPAEENGFQLASQRSVIQNRLVIRHADLTLRVDNLEKVEKNVQKLVRGFGGYVDNASSTDLDSDHPTLTVSMRVPSQSFDEAMSQIEALGIRTGKSIKSEDVTEQVVDMDARIKSMLVQEETYRALLKAARRLDDVISLQQQLTDVRGQIESIQGQRKSLASQASLSSISLTLTQSAIAHQAPKDPNWLAQTWGESTTQMGSLLRGVAAFAIWFAVFCPLWVPLLWLAVRAFKAAQPKKQPMNA
ncbi:MAG: DUF4349 domain-containing protein [Fimbriimonas sp.]